MELLTYDNELFSEIKLLFDNESPCENRNHNDDPNHAGPGRWYLASKACTKCGTDRGVRLVCDSFAQYLLKGGPIACGKCRTFLGNGLEAYKSITWKG